MTWSYRVDRGTIWQSSPRPSKHQHTGFSDEMCMQVWRESLKAGIVRFYGRPVRLARTGRQDFWRSVRELAAMRERIPVERRGGAMSRATSAEDSVAALEAAHEALTKRVASLEMRLLQYTGRR